MASSVQKANDFWFDFDNRFRFNPPADVQQIYRDLGDFDIGINLFRQTRANGTYPAKFIQGLKSKKTTFDRLTRQQEFIIDPHLGSGGAGMTSAFVQFGQGLLTDSRRDLPVFQFNVIHSMDTSGTRPPIGYHRWHGLIRAYTLLNGIKDGQWLEIDRNMALAWAVQSALKPVGSTNTGINPNTKRISPTALGKLKKKYLTASFAKLDSCFDHTPYPDS